ncbi:nicotinamidase-related amidase [Azonexus fungiphilus]|uniref:Nicotinamidase-related amidase n=1 Tax=Azonexus fungiphilus TaxID=146940 RepID=A0A495VP12_9RHOO|nr:hydrolase [Azonexus fungiphilus]RKT51054.1 nicotinamidase-related amidase [Azonexus fungiphilus]
MLISRNDSLLLVVDIQEKLAPAIFEADEITRNSVRLLDGARRLGIPAFVSEHYVQGLGPSVAAIRDAAVDARIFAKTHFSCAAEPGVLDLLQACGRRQVILTGAETHVCVLQTALGLIAAGFAVCLVADAASSRTPANRQLACERVRAAGGQVVSTEMVLFEWLERGGTDEFRALLPLIK